MQQRASIVRKGIARTKQTRRGMTSTRLHRHDTQDWPSRHNAWEPTGRVEKTRCTTTRNTPCVLCEGVTCSARPEVQLPHWRTLMQQMAGSHRGDNVRCLRPVACIDGRLRSRGSAVHGGDQQCYHCKAGASHSASIYLCIVSLSLLEVRRRKFLCGSAPCRFGVQSNKCIMHGRGERPCLTLS